MGLGVGLDGADGAEQVVRDDAAGALLACVRVRDRVRGSGSTVGLR